MKRTAGFLSLALAMLLVAAACSSGGSSTGTGSSDTSAGSGEPFKIGVVTSLSGNYEFLGATTEAGVKAAVEVLNQRGGVQGRQVQSITCNDETNPEAARSCYERLVKNEGVDVLVGFPLAAATEAVAPLVRRDEVPTWVLGGSYGGRDMNGQQYMFSGLPVTEDVLDAVYGWGQSQGHTTSWIVTTDDTTGEPCRTWGDQDAQARHGVEVLGTSVMPATAQSAASQMAEIDRSADFVFMCVSGGAGVVAAKGFDQAGLSMPAVAIHSQGVPFIAKAMSGGIADDKLRVASFCTMGVITGELATDYTCVPTAQEYVDTAKQVAPNVEPDVLGAHAYDGAILLATAASETDGSADAMVDFLQGLTDFPAAMGIYSFGPDLHRGLGPDQLLLGIFRGGSWHLDDPLNLPKS